MFRNRLKNTFCTLDDLEFEKPPQVLLIYLEMEYVGSGERHQNNTYKLEHEDIYLRPLLGLQYLVGAARDIGVEAVVLDNRIISFNEKILSSFIERNNIMLVGMYTSFAHTDINSKFILNLKKLTNIPIIAGGPGYTEYQQLLHAGTDVVIRGEGEQTFKELIQRVQSDKRSWSGINGINYLEDSNIKISPDRPLLDLNSISFPVRDNLNSPTVYKDYILPGYRPPYITMFTNRGCPHNCTFCDSPNVWNNKVRHRSPDNVIKEIDYVIGKWDVRFIDMVDDVFGIDHRWVEEFCTKLIERKHDLKFKILMNPHTFGARQEKTIKLLARSGCNTIGIGMQSAEMKTLVAIRRSLDTPERLIKAVDKCKKNGMLTFVSFIVGFPSDSANAANSIINLVKKAKPGVIDCYPLIFLKGTQLETSLSKGNVFETHSYAKRFEDAKRVRRSFFINPLNLLKLFWWLLRKNPMWILYMCLQVKYFIKFVFGSKANLIKATDNKERIKDIVETKHKMNSPRV